MKAEKRMDLFGLETKCASLLQSLHRQTRGGKSSAFPPSLPESFLGAVRPCSVLAISPQLQSVSRETLLYVQVSLLLLWGIPH